MKRGHWFSFRRNEVSAVNRISEASKWMRGKTPVKFIEAGDGAADAAQRNLLFDGPSIPTTLGQRCKLMRTAV